MVISVRLSTESYNVTNVMEVELVYNALQALLVHAPFAIAALSFLVVFAVITVLIIRCINLVGFAITAM